LIINFECPKLLCLISLIYLMTFRSIIF